MGLDIDVEVLIADPKPPGQSSDFVCGPLIVDGHKHVVTLSFFQSFPDGF
jgi:hypothetical protein